MYHHLDGSFRIRLHNTEEKSIPINKYVEVIAEAKLWTNQLKDNPHQTVYYADAKELMTSIR